MNILFMYRELHSQSLKNDQTQIALGISYISALLKRHGHNTELLVFNKETKRQVIDHHIQEFGPGLIAFTVVSSQYDSAIEVGKYVKAKYPSIYLIAGGPHISLNSEDAIQGPFDAICIGEGEYPTLELVEQLEAGQRPAGIENLWIQNGENVERNPTRPFIDNLDGLPFPDRDMWRGWISEHKMVQEILLGRGCPFQCTYCSNHALKKLASGTYVKLRSPDDVVAEVVDIVTKFPQTRMIYFEVETIGINTEYAVALCDQLEAFNKQRKGPLAFGVNLRVTPRTDYHNLFAALRRAGFSLLNIGLESGSERIREGVLKRHYSNQDFIHAVRLAKSYGLLTGVYAMVGIPGETPADAKETIECLRVCQPDEVFLSIFFPYPGTDLYSLCEREGLLRGNFDPNKERYQAVLDLPGFSKRQIQREFLWFHYNVYRDYKPLIVRLAYVAHNMLSSSFKGHKPLFIRLAYTINNKLSASYAKFLRKTENVGDVNTLSPERRALLTQMIEKRNQIKAGTEVSFSNQAASRLPVQESAKQVLISGRGEESK